MTPELRFELASLITVALPMLLAARLYSLKFRRNAVARVFLAMLIAWVLSVVLTSLLYNPAGIAAEHASGEDFPENRYDNNTISIQFFFGWAYPLLAILASYLLKRMRQKIHGRKCRPSH